MVTRIKPRRPPHLYIAEHREKQGMSQEQLGSRIGEFGVDKGTVSRWENEQQRLNPGKIGEIARALGLEPIDLFHPPDAPKPKDRESLDEIAKDAPPAVYDTAVDIVRRLTRAGS